MRGVLYSPSPPWQMSVLVAPPMINSGLDTSSCTTTTCYHDNIQMLYNSVLPWQPPAPVPQQHVIMTTSSCCTTICNYDNLQKHVIGHPPAPFKHVNMTTSSSCSTCYYDNLQLLYNNMLPWQPPDQVQHVTMTTSSSCSTCYHDNLQLLFNMLTWQPQAPVQHVTITTSGSCTTTFYYDILKSPIVLSIWKI